MLTAAAATGVRRVVLCTSAMVYGALPDNPVPLAEDAPLRAVPDGGLVSRLARDRAAGARRRRAATPACRSPSLRPATVVGPGIDSLLTRHFEAPRLLVVRDSAPRWQFCHVDDLAAALELAALGTVTGVVTVGCEGWLEQEDVETVSGMRRIELPSALAFGTAERLHRLGVIPAPASDLQYVVHPWVVPSTRLREAGWRPTYDNPTALGLLLEQVQRPPRAGLAAGRPARRDHRRRRRGRGRRRHRRPGARGPAEAARMTADGVLRLLDVRDGAAVGRRGASPRWPTPAPAAWRCSSGRCASRTAAGRSTGLGYSAHPGVAGRAAGRRRGGRRRASGARAGRGAPGRRPRRRRPRRRRRGRRARTAARPSPPAGC